MKKYKSKISYGLLGFVFIVFYAPFCFELFTEGFSRSLLGLCATLTFLFAFILYLFFGTEYIIEDKKLKIRCGFFTYQLISIEGVKDISRTNSILSAPAPSFDRILIKYGTYNEVAISPKNKKQFVEDLIKINPNIISSL